MSNSETRSPITQSTPAPATDFLSTDTSADNISTKEITR